MESKKVIVIGGGAAGLIAAGKAAENGHIVTVIEKNTRPARKVMITGKGRCNVTNNCDVNGFISSVAVNPKFLYKAFNTFSSSDVMVFFENLGVPLKTERGNRVFPRSDKSVDIVDALVKYAKRKNTNIINNTVTDIILENGTVGGVILYDGSELLADAVIIATGGLSYPQTGSTGDGYTFANKAGHTIIAPTPSLVSLEIHEGFCSQLMGLSLKNIKIKVIDTINKQKPVFEGFGEMLFTHFGVSGPLILSASAKMKPMEHSRYKIFIDLKPALTNDELDKRICRDFDEAINKDFGNSLDDLLPKKIIPVIIRLCGIDIKTKVNQISRDQRLKLVEIIKHLPLTVKKFRPIDEAVITSGGVKTSEINPSTMESKLIKNLYFAGEVIDVDAYTGGFNLQIAFSTGYLAGDSI